MRRTMAPSSTVICAVWSSPKPACAKKGFGQYDALAIPDGPNGDLHSYSCAGGTSGMSATVTASRRGRQAPSPTSVQALSLSAGPIASRPVNTGAEFALPLNQGMVAFLPHPIRVGSMPESKSRAFRLSPPSPSIIWIAFCLARLGQPETSRQPRRHPLRDAPRAGAAQRPSPPGSRAAVRSRVRPAFGGAAAGQQDLSRGARPRWRALEESQAPGPWQCLRPEVVALRIGSVTGSPCSGMLRGSAGLSISESPQVRESGSADSGRQLRRRATVQNLGVGRS